MERNILTVSCLRVLCKDHSALSEFCSEMVNCCSVLSIESIVNTGGFKHLLSTAKKQNT